MLGMFAFAGGASILLAPLVAATGVLAWGVVCHAGAPPELVMLGAGLLLVGVGSTLPGAPQVRDALLTGLLTGAVCSATLGLLQFFGLASHLGPLASPAAVGEAYGNLRQPNMQATLCWLGVVVVLWAPLPLSTSATVGLVALLAAGCAATVSRTGMVQAIVLSVLVVCWSGAERPRRLALLAAAGGAYLAATAFLPALLEAAQGTVPPRTLWGRLGGESGCSSRLVLWSNVLHLISMRPLTGWGWGELDFAHFSTLYPGARFCDILDNAHNLPLHLAVELGVPASMAICGGATWWVVRQRPWREPEVRRQLAWAMLALILVHSMLEYPLWYGPFQLAFGAALGWLLAPEKEVATTAKWPNVAACAALLAATGYVAWDYARVSQIYLPPEQRLAPWRQEPLQHAQRSWLFANQARFAELTLTPLTLANAATVHQLATDMLHYSPEPRVIERLIESATMLGREDEAVFYLARYRAAFPSDYEAWRARQRGGAGAQG
jgi:hypothetical protein